MSAAVDREQFAWSKRGRIFVPAGQRPWMQSHAQNPFVRLRGERLRLYFNCRSVSPEQGVRAYPAYVELDRADPQRVLGIAERPLLELGALGTFDQFGVMGCGIVDAGDGAQFYYYVGWSRCLGVPYNHAIGLAISSDAGDTFARYGDGPILTRTPNEPYIQNSPFVTRFDDVWHMWYSTGLRWIDTGSSAESIYVIVHATSREGKTWERDGVPCIAPVLDAECQTNPSVVRIGNRYHLWFCYRCGTDFRNADRGYRIGYAWSDDAATWHRDDAAGELLPSPGDGWDSQMVCYPSVFELDGRLTMVYSGNYFGRDGVGYAVAEATSARA